jgi:hypothetical protein
MIGFGGWKDHLVGEDAQGQTFFIGCEGYRHTGEEAKVHEVTVTPTTLAKLGQAIDYRFRIRGEVIADEDGADLVGALGELYRWLSQKHLEAAYEGDDIWKNNTNRMTMEQAIEALGDIDQFGMLELLQIDESAMDAYMGEGN